jgi:hypothetical protein
MRVDYVEGDICHALPGSGGAEIATVKYPAAATCRNLTGCRSASRSLLRSRGSGRAGRHPGPSNRSLFCQPDCLLIVYQRTRIHLPFTAF